MFFLMLMRATPDEYWLARAIEGEAGITTQEVAFAIEDTIFNRQQLGWCDSIKDCVTSGYWGYRRVQWPSEHSIALARSALGRKYRDRNPIFFAFSRGDRIKLCISRKPMEVHETVHGPIYFYNNHAEILNGCKCKEALGQRESCR